MAPRILITGSHGQLGEELQKILRTGQAEIGPISSFYDGAEVYAVDLDELDITDAEAVNRLLADKHFDIVINCAAYTNVDGCEKNPEIAAHANGEGPRILAEACAKNGSRLVHVSTDYVFAGNEPGSRVETDTPNPLSMYGKTKLAGEEAVLAAAPESFIVRTAWLYGYKGKNFLRTMQRLAQSQDRIEVVDDQWGNPTSANDLAYEILALAPTENFGIYHVTNNGTCSWFDFARAIVDATGTGTEVEPISTEEYRRKFPDAAERPRYSSLDNAHLRATIGDQMRTWEEALASFLENDRDL